MRNGRTALKQYSQVDVYSGLESASPHQMIEMLLNGAVDCVAKAKGQLERSDIPGKCENISKAVGILDGLRAGLDKEVGGKIAENLDDLYVYMGRRLVEANLKNDTVLLDEVGGLLGQIRSAWNGIPRDVIKEHANRNQEIPQVG